MRSQREPGHDAEAAPPPPPLIAQNRSECVQALAIRTAPSAVTISAFQQARRRQAVGLRKGAEAAALDQARHAHRQAAPTLDVAAGLRRHGVVNLTPDRPGLDRDGRLRVDPGRHIPLPIKASCTVMAFIRRVQISRASAALDVP